MEAFQKAVEKEFNLISSVAKEEVNAVLNADVFADVYKCKC